MQMRVSAYSKYSMVSMVYVHGIMYVAQFLDLDKTHENVICMDVYVYICYAGELRSAPPRLWQHHTGNLILLIRDKYPLSSKPTCRRSMRALNLHDAFLEALPPKRKPKSIHL